ncbi:MAG: MFS transporter [Bacteroidetes bacterium]|nr:MFS transporter [Bacteroidota bacterium]MBU1115675.1 MFS transporter [Bacteroidota bacterium]MBU1799012.1 MFS transporter [Bacteroidota bacterium]
MQENKIFQQDKVITISFAHFVHDVYTSFLAPILPLLIVKFSLSFSFVSFLTVIQRVPSLFNPIVGYFSDNFPIRYVLIAIPALSAIMMSFLGLMPSVSLIVILLLASGIGASLFHVPAPIMVKHVSGNRIGKGMSYFMLGGEIARSLGPLYILGGISLWGLEGTYRLLPLGLLASLMLYFKFRNIPIAGELKKKEKETGAIKALKKHLQLFVTIGGIFFFTSLVKGSLTTFLPTYMTENGSSLWIAGIALSIVQFAGAAGTLFSGTISDKIGRRFTLMIMACTTPFLLLLFAFFSQTIFAIPILILIGFIMFATTPVLLAEINIIKSEHSGLLNGVFMTLNFASGALAMLLIGVFGDLFGLKTTYIIAALISFISILFITRLPKTKIE